MASLNFPSHQKHITINNWAKTFQCVPQWYFQPQNQQELQQILGFAQTKNLRVRVVGARHSPSDIICTCDIMINLDRMNRLLHVDKDKLQITVEAGMRLKELNELATQHHMSLSSLGSISEQSIAGAIGTATHGTGKQFGNISCSVVSLELMLSNGESIFCSRESNKDVFLCALCHLGCLGVIVSITLQCEPRFKLQATQIPDTLENVLNNLEKFVSSGEHFRFWWFPHTEKVVRWVANRTDKELTNNGSWFWDKFVGFHLLESLLWISTFIPSIVPWINKTFFRLLFESEKSVVGWSHDVFNFDCLFEQYVTEWSIPVDCTAVALRELKTMIEKNNIKAHFPIEVRFVKEDDIWLSPSYQRCTCYIGIIHYRPFGKDTPIQPYWQEYEQIMSNLGGRPHWAKSFSLTPDDLRVIYPRFDDFLSVRSRLDPENRFTNEYIERHLIARNDLRSKL